MHYSYSSNARLDHVGLQTPDPSRLADFYCSTLRMRRRNLGDDTPICEGPERTILFTRGEAQQLKFCAFGFDNENELQERRARLEARGICIEQSPSPLFDDRAFGFTDPEGNLILFGIMRPNDIADAPRARLQHLVIASPDPERLAAFYEDVVGFWLSDRVVDDEGQLRAVFLRSDEEHHSFAIFRGASPAVDHHSYELDDWNSMRDWADRFAAQDLELIWGPGRHGPGNNLFFFILDPDGNRIELSAEIELLPADLPSKTVRFDRRAFNIWGSAPMRAS